MEIQSYGAAMASVTPGTFVPDLTPKAPASTLLAPDDTTDAAGAAGAVSFKDTVKQMLDNVNDKMTEANTASVDLATGKSTDFEGTVKANEEASLAFQFTESIRSKLMEAYTQIEQMQF
jgi:flagellar hook-basal body complex protein FliE